MSAEYINPDSLEQRIERLERLMQRLPAVLDATRYVDANSWEVSQRLDGRKEYRRRWLATAMPAFAVAVILAAVALPVGVTNLGAVHLDAIILRATNNAAFVLPAAYGDDTSTTLTIAAATTDGTNLSAKTATADIFVTLVARS